MWQITTVPTRDYVSLHFNFIFIPQSRLMFICLLFQCRKCFRRHPFGEVQGLERKSGSLKKNLRENSRKEKLEKLLFKSGENSEENPEDEEPDCICSGVKSEGQKWFCDKTFEDFYGTVHQERAWYTVHCASCSLWQSKKRLLWHCAHQALCKINTFAKELLLSLLVRVRDKCK